MESPCPGCGAPIRDFLCTSCSTALVDRLVDVRALMEELEVTLTRQSRIVADGPRGRAADTPLAFNWRASESAWKLQQVLARWSSRLAAAHLAVPVMPVSYRLTDPKDPARIFPRRGVAEAHAHWLLQHLAWFAGFRDSPAMLDEITEAIRNAWRVVDRPGLRAYVGRCGSIVEEPFSLLVDEQIEPIGFAWTQRHCTGELYARPHDKLVSCPDCDTLHDVAARREDMLRRAALMPVTAAQASRAIPMLSQLQVTASMIRGYATRGRIEPCRAPDNATTPGPYYRLGDIVAVVAEVQAKRDERAKVANG